jgi:predicted nucleotidyltransferase
MKDNTKQDIDKIVERLVMLVNPEKIIIFGSVANNLEHSESDIDLCVIMNMGNNRKIDIIRQIRRNIIEIIDRPLDILVYDRVEFETRAQIVSTFEHKILKEGVRVA